MPTTARKPASAVSKTQKLAADKAKPEAKPEPTSLIEALAAGQVCLLKVRANGTRRSLPYLAVGTEQRKQAEAVVEMREEGQTVDAIADTLKVSIATARRFITNLDLALAVEAGKHDGAWKPGAREVVVQVVGAK